MAREVPVDLVLQAVKEQARDGKLACATAFQIAEKLGVPRLEVGKAADFLGVKIVACQLGCFR